MEARTCWFLVHPDGRVKWKSIDFRKDRPKTLTWFTKWRWQRWVVSPAEIMETDDHGQLRTSKGG